MHYFEGVYYNNISMAQSKTAAVELQCVGNGATAVPHQAIDISFYFFQKSGDTRWDDNGSDNDEWCNNLINPARMIVSR